MIQRSVFAALLAAIVAAPSALAQAPTSASGAPADIKPIRISGLGIRVSDLQRSKKFYTEVLGLKVGARVPAKGDAHEYCFA